MKSIALACTRYLLRSVHADGGWHNELRAHVDTFLASPLISLASAGFPGNWIEGGLWQ